MLTVKRDETCKVSPGFSSRERADGFVRTSFRRKMGAAERLQWIDNGGGDIPARK